MLLQLHSIYKCIVTVVDAMASCIISSQSCWNIFTQGKVYNQGRILQYYISDYCREITSSHF